MRRTNDQNPSHQRGAAIIEYVLMVIVLVIGVGVAIPELEHGAESSTKTTSEGIAGDPYSPSTTTTAPTGPTTSLPEVTVPVNERPRVIVPDTTVPPGTDLTIRTSIVDDITPLDLMDITVTMTTGLGGDGTFVEDNVNTPGVWIEHDHTTPTPGVYFVEVCAFDGILEGCGTGRVKVTAGLVSVEATPEIQPYYFDDVSGEWVWDFYVHFMVRDETGNPIPNIDFVQVSYTVTAVYDRGFGEETITIDSIKPYL
jgi:hypothetical protein